MINWIKRLLGIASPSKLFMPCDADIRAYENTKRVLDQRDECVGCGCEDADENLHGK